MTFLAKQEYFTGRGLKGRAKAVFVRGTGLIPIDRGNSDAAAAALAAGARALRKGMLLVIYPEGTRSPDGRLYRGKTGLARLAMETGVPVVPVAMIGTDRVQPIGRVLPRLSPVEIRIGAPIPPPPTLTGAATDPSTQKLQARGFTDRIMATIAALSGQERAADDAASYKTRTRVNRGG